MSCASPETGLATGFKEMLEVKNKTEQTLWESEEKKAGKFNLETSFLKHFQKDGIPINIHCHQKASSCQDLLTHSNPNSNLHFNFGGKKKNPDNMTPLLILTRERIEK